MSRAHERRNREFWDADADDYQAAHGTQLGRGKVWGAWAIPETELDVLGEVRGRAVLELGCGGADWSVALAREGARVVALDQSRAQLHHAAQRVREAEVDVHLVCASGEMVPLRDDSFDLVFCDHGAMSFCDPNRSVPEVARLLRSGGALVFNKATLLLYMSWNPAKKRQSTRLHSSYFDSRIYDFGEGTIDFQITYGDWIRLFRSHGMVVEDLLELRPPVDATTTYDDFAPHDWARRWPAEEIWTVRKI